jgi:hypothetical protein
LLEVVLEVVNIVHLTNVVVVEEVLVVLELALLHFLLKHIP